MFLLNVPTSMVVCTGTHEDWWMLNTKPTNERRNWRWSHVRGSLNPRGWSSEKRIGSMENAAEVLGGWDARRRWVIVLPSTYMMEFVKKDLLKIIFEAEILMYWIWKRLSKFKLKSWIRLDRVVYRIGADKRSASAGVGKKLKILCALKMEQFSDAMDWQENS